MLERKAQFFVQRKETYIRFKYRTVGSSTKDPKLKPTSNAPTNRLMPPRALFLASLAAIACASLMPQLQCIAQARSLRMRPLSSYTSSNFLASTTPANEKDGDATHAYFRPPREETGGFPNNTRKYHRAPCPCLNTLANHGYFPRDGKNLTPALVKRVIVQVFNLQESLAESLTNALPPVFTLADLGVHNFIEHDASMVHDDEYFKLDPSLVNTTLADDLFSRAGKDQLLTKRIVAHFRADRETQCAKTDPEYDFGFKRQASAYAEAAAFLLAMGDYEREVISVADARSFLVDEKFPSGWKKSESVITTTTALYVAAQIKFLASLPWLVETE